MPDTPVELLSAIKLLLEKERNRESSTEKNRSSSVKFDPYNEAEETFENFINRFENYVNLIGEKDEAKKVGLILNYIGPKTFQLLSNLTSPEDPKTKNYSDIVTTLKSQLQPVSHVIMERYKFGQRTQLESENVAMFVAALRTAAVHCGFKCDGCKINTTETHLCTQFVLGVRDPEIREQLLQMAEGDTFQQAVDLALAIEAAKVNSEQMRKATVVQHFVNRVQQNERHHKNVNNQKPPQDHRGKPKVNSQNNRNNKSNLKGTSVWKKCGIKRNQCLRCGQEHSTRECWLDENVVCRSCSKRGHIEKICINKRLKENQSMRKPKVNSIRFEPTFDSSIHVNSIGISQMFEVNQIGDPSALWKKVYVNIEVEGVAIQFEADCGCPITAISEKLFRQVLPQKEIEPIRVGFKQWLGASAEIVGACKVRARYNGVSRQVTLFVTKNDDACPLVGLEWIRLLGIGVDKLIHGTNTPHYQLINSIVNSVSENDELKSSLMREFPKVFEEGVGIVPNVKCHLTLRADAKPKFFKHRVVPYALKKQIEDLLDIGEKSGIFTKIENSQWGTPLIPVVQNLDDIRLCADYRLTVNIQLEDDHHPIPRTEEMFNRLKGCKKFCLIDLSKAYLHLGLDEESSRVLALSTHKGTYAVNRLYFGVKTAPSIWQRFMDGLIGNLDGTACYFDDIVIGAEDEKTLLERIRIVLKKLEENNLHANLKKCRFFCDAVEYLGHEINAEGIRPLGSKVEAILEAPEPKSIEEVQQLLGLINYYRRFIKDASSILHPSNAVLKQKKFSWSNTCKEAFQKVKESLASSEVLVPYDPDLPLILATDASPYGLSGVLSHRMPDGTERPITYVSRTLSKAEKNYSQLDKEATAVIWALKKVFQYCYGRQFTLVIDNRPLMSIFSPEKNMPPLVAARMLRYAQFLSGFSYNIVCKRSAENANADYISRNPTQSDKWLSLTQIRNSPSLL